jgi:alpha-galactosidase
LVYWSHGFTEAIFKKQVPFRITWICQIFSFIPHFLIKESAINNHLLDQVKISADSNQKVQDGLLLSGPRVTVDLLTTPRLFYRHGWQSWSLAAWIDPSSPPVPISSPILSGKDEDPLYANSLHHTSAWVGAVQQIDGSIILLGALDLGGRVELDGACLRGFYESGEGKWFIAQGTEQQVFASYASRLEERFCRSIQDGTAWETRRTKIPRVWCSWYSLYAWVTETSFLHVLDGLQDLPFDVVQLDDGWELNVGDWEANKKFPSGLAAIANKIRAGGRIPGLWLAPFMVSLNSNLARQHPDWLLRNEHGQPVKAGLSWNGITYALDTSHPEVLAWLDDLIRKVRGWGYEYLKLDFLYAGALPGKRKNDLPREAAYRRAMQVIRAAAGEAYILGCAALIIPSLGLCDGMRIGPDVAPFWINTPMSVWLNNPAHPSARNALRTSLHRLWLQPVVHTDPDVAYFRSRHNALSPQQMVHLRDLSLLSHFKSTSDLPAWLAPAQRQELSDFLSQSPQIERLDRYRFRINGRKVDFSSIISLPGRVKFPASLATALGLYDMVVHEAIPAIIESFKFRSKEK